MRDLDFVSDRRTPLREVMQTCAFMSHSQCTCLFFLLIKHRLWRVTDHCCRDEIDTAAERTTADTALELLKQSERDDLPIVNGKGELVGFALDPHAIISLANDFIIEYNLS